MRRGLTALPAAYRYEIGTADLYPVIGLYELSSEERARFDIVDAFDDFTPDGWQFVDAVDLLGATEECPVVLVRMADDYDPDTGVGYAYAIPFHGPLRPANLVNLSGEPTVQEWPFHSAHREAKCGQCKGPLSDLSPTNNAPGRGHYRGVCERCGARTWYDCAEGTVELIQQNEHQERVREAGKLSDARRLVGDAGSLHAHEARIRHGVRTAGAAGRVYGRAVRRDQMKKLTAAQLKSLEEKRGAIETAKSDVDKAREEANDAITEANAKIQALNSEIATFNEKREEYRAELEELVNEAQSWADERSEKWHEGEAAERHEEWRTALEEAGEITEIDEYEEIEFPEVPEAAEG